MISEDIRALGDVLYRPFEFIGQQVDFYQQRKNAAQAQKIRQEEARFNQQLDLERQKFNAELDDFIARKEIERNTLIAQSIANYQKTMAQCAVSIGKSLGEMHVDLLERATELVNDKRKELKALQDEAMDTAVAQMEKISTLKSESARKMLESKVDKILDGVIERSNEFMKTLDREFSEMTKTIKDTTQTTMINAQKYVSPTFAKNSIPSQTGDKKLLESN